MHEAEDEQIDTIRVSKSSDEEILMFLYTL